MHTEETIAAISTPLGHGGIGIVRLSGNKAIEIADRIFRSSKKKNLKTSPSYRIHYGHVINPENREIIDEVLVSVMKAPATYTKEDIVEINCHGGPIPLRRVLELVLSHGARLAAPGEFTQRAFLNGRIDLAQAEAVLDTINSLTVESQKSALNQLQGSLSKKLNSIRNEMIELTALVEAHIDFPEEDIGSLSESAINKRALKIKTSLEKLIQGSQYGIVLREGVKTAIIGRPNVGKSSLLNALLDQDKAIVTEIPGTTRDVIEDFINIDGIPIRIMDTAGIRDVKDIAEREGVRRSINSMKEADLVLLILDSSRKTTLTDSELIEKSRSKNTLFVINKIDLPEKLHVNEKHIKTVRISAKTGEGLDGLKTEIRNAIVTDQKYPGAELVTNIRHAQALKSALTAMNEFESGMKKNISPEFLSVELRESLDSIGDILGVTTPEEILNRIFDNFCIGK